MPEHAEQPERSPVWAATVALAAVIVAYPFSYALVVRVHGGGWKRFAATDGYGNPAIVSPPVSSEDLTIY